MDESEKQNPVYLMYNSKTTAMVEMKKSKTL